MCFPVGSIQLFVTLNSSKLMNLVSTILRMTYLHAKPAQITEKAFNQHTCTNIIYIYVLYTYMNNHVHRALLENTYKE